MHMYKKSLKIPKEVGNQKMLNEGKKTPAYAQVKYNFCSSGTRFQKKRMHKIRKTIILTACFHIVSIQAFHYKTV